MDRPSDIYCYCAERYNKEIDFNIIRLFGEEVINEIMLNEDGVEMPHPFGLIFILAIKNNNRVIDVYNTKKYGKTIFYDNSETDDFRFKPVVKLYFKKRKYERDPIKWGHFFGFKGGKKIKKSIFNQIKKKWYHWKQVNSIKHL